MEESGMTDGMTPQKRERIALLRKMVSGHSTDLYPELRVRSNLPMVLDLANRAASLVHHVAAATTPPVEAATTPPVALQKVHLVRRQASRTDRTTRA